jgi:hypothetical protein
MASPSVPSVLSDFPDLEPLLSLLQAATLQELHPGVKSAPVRKFDAVVKSSKVDYWQMAGVRCPTCAANGQEVWVIPGKACGYCGTYC